MLPSVSDSKTESDEGGDGCPEEVEGESDDDRGESLLLSGDPDSGLRG